MKQALMIALAALPLVACVGSLEDAEEFEETDDLATTQQPLLADYLVDFDQVLPHPPLPTNGTPVASGTIVDSLYSRYGVKFSCVTASKAVAATSCSSGHVFASITTTSNTVVPNPGLWAFDVRDGVVQAEFASPRKWVTIDVTPVMNGEQIGSTDAIPWLAAYDTNNQLISTVLYPGARPPNDGWDQAQTLGIDARSAKIKYVRFSSTFVHNFPWVRGKFDNLRFNGDPLTISDRPPLPPFRPFP